MLLQGKDREPDPVPVPVREDPALVAEQRQIGDHGGDRLDAGLQLDEERGAVAGEEAGRAVQDGQFAAVHVDLDETHVPQAEPVERDAGDVHRAGVDVPADQ